MKFAITILSLFLAVFCAGQAIRLNQVIVNLTLKYVPATIHLTRDTFSINLLPVGANGKKIIYNNIEAGWYKISVSGPGKPKQMMDSIDLKKGQHLVLHIDAKGECLYAHPKNYVPICPKNHNDNIIPIVYGLIAERGNTFIKNSMDEKVHYGGCVITSCDPNFYCKIHEIEF
jgi:hypothetical protein